MLSLSHFLGSEFHLGIIIIVDGYSYFFTLAYKTLRRDFTTTIPTCLRSYLVQSGVVGPYIDKAEQIGLTAEGGKVLYFAETQHC